MSSVGRAFLDFVVSHTFCVPEDPASLLIDRLAGKRAIKNFSPARARSAATCWGRPALELDARRNFSTSTEIRKFSRGLSISVPTTSRRLSDVLPIVSSLAVLRVLDETKVEYEPTLTDRAIVDGSTHGLSDSLGTTPGEIVWQRVQN